MTKKALVIRPCIEIEKKLYMSGELNVCPDDRVLYRGMLFLYLCSSPGSLAVASALKRSGLEVEYLDVACEYGIPLSREKIEECYSMIERRLQQNKYDLVGISCTAGNEYPMMLRIAEIAKKINPKGLIIIGGYHAAALAEEIITKPGVDLVLKSDFEPIVKELLAALNDPVQNLENIPNAVCRINGSIKNTAVKNIKINMDSTDLDFSLCEDYLPTYMSYFVECSRGCPYKCRFCQEKVLRHGHSCKSVSKAVASIANSVEYIYERINEPISLFFADPIWGLSRKWIQEFCDKLIERIVDLPKFYWGCLGVVGGYTSDDMVKMKQAGCSFISYGVESFSPRMLNIIDKTRNARTYMEKIYSCFIDTIKNDISAEANIIIGCPGETRETLLETEENMTNLYTEISGLNTNAEISFEVRLFSPLPATAFYIDLVANYYAALGTEVTTDQWWEKGIFPYVCATLRPSYEVTTQMAIEALTRLSNIADHKLNLWERSLLPKNLRDKDIITPVDMKRIGSFHTGPRRINRFYSKGKQGEFETISINGLSFCFPKAFSGRNSYDERGNWSYCEYYNPPVLAEDCKRKGIIGLAIYWEVWDNELNKELALNMCQRITTEEIFSTSCRMEMLNILSLPFKGYIAVMVDARWTDPVTKTEGPIRFAVVHNTNQERLYVIGIIIEQNGDNEKERRAMRYVKDNILPTFKFI